jgi:malonyl-CoA decarboxylase
MNAREQTGEAPRMIQRTISNIGRAWKDLTGATRVRLTGSVRPDLPEADRKRLARQIDECLLGRGGAVSERARAADLGHTYSGLNAVGRRRFLELLGADYGVDEKALSEATAAWSALRRSGDGCVGDMLARCQTVQSDMRAALRPPRVHLLSRFTTLPNGVKFLVDMRAELIPLARSDPQLKGLDDDMRRLFASWFDVGFLELRCITWDAPASLLEKLAHYEAVHAIESWSDIKNRLAPDRRCYAFFHPQLPEEPLIYLWVALVQGLSNNVQELLDVSAPTGNPSEADTAIFYSISNAQAGLAGISFGSFLIKRVVEDLTRDFKNLRVFATLSPIPGFTDWLNEQIADSGEALLRPSELRRFSELSPDPTGIDVLTAIQRQEGLFRKETVQEAIRAPLMRMCAQYVTGAKRGQYARDRVAHFHLSNGARIERINWLADTSPNGMNQSLGMMINYLYKSRDIEDNHEAYSGKGRIRTSKSVKALLKDRG